MVYNIKSFTGDSHRTSDYSHIVFYLGNTGELQVLLGHIFCMAGRTNLVNWS